MRKRFIKVSSADGQISSMREFHGLDVDRFTAILERDFFSGDEIFLGADRKNSYVANGLLYGQTTVCRKKYSSQVNIRKSNAL